MSSGVGVAGALLLAAGSLFPAPEIARILLGGQIDPPSAALLQTLSAADVQAVLQRRDPYASYLGPEQYRRFLEGSRESSSVGIHFYPREGDWWLQPIPDGPAWRAGLQADVRLLSVDGEGVRGREAGWLRQCIQGAREGSVLFVVQADDGRSRAVRVPLQAFRAPSLSLVEGDGIRFVRLWEFRRRETVDALRDALARLHDEDRPLVLDLRRAAGGDLFEALDSASLFLPEGLSLGAIEDNRGQRREFRSVAGRATGRPVLLLTGPGTASAAEAFAGALRHHGAALLIGQRSYGKCLTQTLTPLSNGGAIRFSNGVLWGPDGVACDRQGLRPDIPVDDVDKRGVGELVDIALTSSPRRTFFTAPASVTASSSKRGSDRPGSVSNGHFSGSE
jgi:carboxyl-terminal processing protease